MTTKTMRRPSKKQTAKTLRKAADHIERVGLLKGRFYPESVLEDQFIGTEELVRLSKEVAKDAPCCTLGGIYFAARNIAEVYAAEAELGLAIPVRYMEDVAEWSDMPSRRKGQVVKKLRDVAEKLEAA